MSRSVVTYISGALALIGIAVLLKSPPLGLSAANSWLASIGGSSDTQQFMAMVTGYMQAYRILGAILTVMGLVGCLHQIKDLASRSLR